MNYEVVFFDFDGTLVDSGHAKRAGFFRLFPPKVEYRRIVESVLSRDPDGSRYRVIPAILEEAGARNVELPQGTDLDSLVAKYQEYVFSAVSQSPAMLGADELLKTLWRQGKKLFICSNTPHEDLVALVKIRGWAGFFEDTAGYPNDKAQYISRTIEELNVSREAVALVGDGVSDLQAARRAGVKYYPVTGESDLVKVGRQVSDRVYV